jgi:hypothetical protein
VRTFNFTLIASGLDPTDPSFEERLFESGCGDATVSFQRGVLIFEFEREARTFAKALISGLVDVQKAGAKVTHVEPDHLVNLSEIAERSNLSRAAISLYASGQRGRDFPTPVARLTTESPLWDWVDVSKWMFHKGTISRLAVVEAQIVRNANAIIRTPGLPTAHPFFTHVVQARLLDWHGRHR